MVRQEELPAASNARTVITFVPCASGTSTFQVVVPAASPDRPVEFCHLTAATAMLSDAMPRMVITAADTETILPDGDVIFKAGGVVSGVDRGAGEGVGTDCRVTVKERVVRFPAASVAVIVNILAPELKGTATTLHS